MMAGQPAARALELTTASILERLDSDIRASRMKCVALPLTVLQDALTREGAS
jgi:hypothetical protein